MHHHSRQLGVREVLASRKDSNNTACKIVMSKIIQLQSSLVSRILENAGFKWQSEKPNI